MSIGERPETKRSLMRRRSQPGRAFKRKSHLLKRDREGVASTIGTIMALLVFITFLALITNSYVPAWMVDNERGHMNQLLNQFGQLKGEADSMIVSAQITGNTMEMYAPFTLGSQGVPVLANPTAGQLTYVPQGANTTGLTVKFNYTANNQTHSMNANGGGKVEFYAPNRYYVQQWISYENGAIIVDQVDGQVVRAFPSLEIKKIAGSNNIAFTEIDLIGLNISKTGTDSVGLNIDLLYVDSQAYQLTGDRVWSLQVNSLYGSAWYTYFQDLCNRSGLVSGSDYSITKTPSTINPDAYMVKLDIKSAGALTWNRAYLSISLLT